VRPEIPQNEENLRDRCGVSGRRGIPGVADDTQHAVFSNWAGCPCLLAFGRKPMMSIIMADVCGVNQRNEDIYIE